MPDPIEQSAAGVDLSPRVVASTSVVASPSAAAETIIVTVTVPGNVAILSGVLLICQAALTVGTNGVSLRLRIRQTDASGTVKADTGACTTVAANLESRAVVGFDTAPAAGRVYVGTLTVGSASAASTVSAVALTAVAV